MLYRLDKKKITETFCLCFLLIGTGITINHNGRKTNFPVSMKNYTAHLNRKLSHKNH